MCVGHVGAPVAQEGARCRFPLQVIVLAGMMQKSPTFINVLSYTAPCDAAFFGCQRLRQGFRAVQSELWAGLDIQG